MQKNVAVVGSGGWGTAVAVLLDSIGHNITLWSWKKDESDRLKNDLENKEFLPGIILKDTINFTSDISCVKNKDLVVLVCPSQSMRATAKSMAPYINDNSVIVILSKGLETGTLKTLDEVVSEEIPNATICVMSGPSHAEEVARGIPTVNVVASKNLEAAKFVQDIFMSKNFRVYTCDDVIGVEMGGALKNVIALCAGIADGIGFGDNTKAALMTRGMKEISRLGVKMGAKSETFSGLTGIGDLIVTCTSMHSRNRRAGILIGQGKSLDEALNEVHMVVEGVHTTKAAYNLAQKHKIEMPIINQAYDVLFNGKNAQLAVVELMSRDKKEEII